MVQVRMRKTIIVGLHVHGTTRRAATAELRCEHCFIAHGNVGKDKFDELGSYDQAFQSISL